LVDYDYTVDLAVDGEEGLALAEQHAYDVIILDVLLPRLDGIELVRRLRQRHNNVPVLMLTARDTIEDKVAGLDAGADDYLVKPFEFAELLARLRALIRRAQTTRPPELRVKDVVIDTVKKKVWRGDLVLSLSAREYALLEYLATHANQVVSRSDIWEHVYDFHSEAQSNVVDVYVGYLRKKLGAPTLIHTRRGVGYVFGDDL
ncbi:MAG: response regulator transcription factor, partial [Kofleriaceae bacterium]